MSALCAPSAALLIRYCPAKEVKRATAVRRSAPSKFIRSLAQLTTGLRPKRTMPRIRRHRTAARASRRISSPMSAAPFSDSCIGPTRPDRGSWRRRRIWRSARSNKSSADGHVHRRRNRGTCIVVPGEGIEPSLCCQNWILSPARLPIPPSRLVRARGAAVGRTLPARGGDGIIAETAVHDKWGRRVRCPIARATAFPISITNCRAS